MRPSVMRGCLMRTLHYCPWTPQSGPSKGPPGLPEEDNTYIHTYISLQTRHLNQDDVQDVIINLLKI